MGIVKKRSKKKRGSTWKPEDLSSRVRCSIQIGAWKKWPRRQSWDCSVGDPRQIFSYQCHHNDVSWKGQGTLQERNGKTMNSYCILHINCLFPPLGTWWEPSNRSLTQQKPRLVFQKDYSLHNGLHDFLNTLGLLGMDCRYSDKICLVEDDDWFPSWGDIVIWVKGMSSSFTKAKQTVWFLVWPTCGAWKMVRCACKLNLPKVEMKLEKKLTQPSPNKCFKV